MGQEYCCNYAPKDGNLQKFGGGLGKNIVVNNAELLKAYSVGK